MSRFEHIQTDGDAPASAGTDEFDFDHYRTLADRARNHGEFEKALRLYGRALERDRTRAEGWLGQVRVLLEMGQAEEAETWLEQAARILGEVPGILALRSISAVRAGKLDDARAWSDRAMRAGDDDPEVWFARAEVVYAGGNIKVARINLDKGHERSPSADTARRAGEVALERDDTATAQRWFARAATEDPENPLIAMRLGVCLERMHEWDRARNEFERAILLSPDMKSARLALADLDARGWMARVMANLRGLLNGKMR